MHSFKHSSKPVEADAARPARVSDILDNTPAGKYQNVPSRELEKKFANTDLRNRRERNFDTLPEERIDRTRTPKHMSQALEVVRIT